MRIVTTLATLLAIATPALAQAQDIDPSGVIHAMTGPHRHHRHHWRHHMHVPRYLRHVRHFGIALPPGTDRPGRTRTFIPAR